MKDIFLRMCEYGAAGMYEEPNRSLFYRKALGIRRYFENCELPMYEQKPLYPSGKIVPKMNISPHYFNGMTIPFYFCDENPKIAKQFKKDFWNWSSSVPAVHTVAGNMWTHSMPYYERVLKEGLLSYVNRINKIEDDDYREGFIHLIEGIKAYLERIVHYLEEINADRRLINALKKVPMHPAEDIYEAIVCWNFIMYLDLCDNLGCVASGLFPYYRGEDITDLLRNLYDNLDANDGYTMVLNTDYNELTLQCLEASKGRRRPMIELFVDENTPKEVWEKAYEVIRSSNGQPAFYNPNILLKGLQEKIPKITDQDIKFFCGCGCTESMISGMSNVGSLDAGINLLYIFEQVMKTKLSCCDTFEEFYNFYLHAVEKDVDIVTTEINNTQREREKYNPLPMRSLLIDDCIDRGIDYNAGGARYKWSIINFAGLINVIDSLLVIRDLIFKEKKYTALQFLESLSAEDNDEFLKELREHPTCFGRDISEVNNFSNKISAEIFGTLKNKKPYIGECFLPSSIQFRAHEEAGAWVGATPDGRKAHSPLCDSLAAIFGKDIKGPTALLNSVASLDLKEALGTPVLNFNINPDFKGDILRSLILGYFKSGGIQMQISCVSRELLEEAYKNPEMHKNLVVRVGGYSEYFYRLTDELKRMIINRTIQKEV